MDVRLLGPLEVDEGERVQIEAPKQRAVLEVLAIFADADVASSTLIDAMWGDSPPPTAAKSLHSHVSRLRGVLPEGAIVTDGQAYRLDLDPDDVDAHRFERLVVAAGQAIDGDEPARALELTDAAIDLWRGRPLEDLADGVVLEGQGARLDELLGTAREVRLAALVGLGRHEQAIADAEVLTASHPLRESGWAHLMMSLYRAGRRAEAIEAYGRVRRVLRDELGVSPAAALRELESKILEEDPTLDAPMLTPRVLPSPRTPFIGREALVSDVCGLFEDHRLITLCGPGGVGKTRLAVEVARVADAQRWKHGVWWVDLNGYRGPGWLTQRLISALGVALPPGMPADDGLRRFAARRSMLLVVDRAEVDTEEVARIVSQLLDAAPDLSVLVTSRLPLDVEGERLVRVAPLALPSPDADDPAGAEAVRLFLSRRENQRGAPPDDDPDVVADLCRMVDGLPLGIEIIAARVGVSPAEDMLARLRADPRSVLTGGGTADDPHRSLNVVLDSTLALMDQSARTLFARLAVFPATFDLAAVRALGGPSARVDLGHLVDAALVVDVETEPGERRFRLTDPTRTYADSLLDDDARDEAVRQHAKHFRALLVRAGHEMTGKRDRRWIQRLERDDANVRIALDWWIDHEPARALVFADGLGRAMQFGTHDAELCALFDRMLDAAFADDRVDPSPLDVACVDPNPLDVACVRLRRGWPRFLMGDFEGGLDDMRRAGRVFDELDDAAGAAEAHAGVGHMIVLATADADAASASYARAIEASRRAQAVLMTAMALAECAQSLILVDRVDADVDAMLDEAEALFRDADDPGGLAHVMMDRMLVAYRAGDLVAAERCADESIRWSRAGQETNYEQISLIAKGVVPLERGVFDEAAKFLAASVRLAVETQNMLQLGVALHAVAVYAALAGQPLQAARVRGAASVLAPMWPMFARRYGELAGEVFDDLGSSLNTELAAGAALDLDDVLDLVDGVLTSS